MQPHPEGGFYKQTYQSEDTIAELNRRYATAIYFLLHDEQFSAFHRIQSDELWHFYTGSPLEVLVLHDSGELQTLQLSRKMMSSFRRWFRLGNGLPPDWCNHNPMPWWAAPCLRDLTFVTLKWPIVSIWCSNFRSTRRLSPVLHILFDSVSKFSKRAEHLTSNSQVDILFSTPVGISASLPDFLSIRH